ncbi:MAG: caspase family protein, partial [Chloroflexia bacterium]|nr:caspase family protein [Chloroflexia bacterium]
IDVNNGKYYALIIGVNNYEDKEIIDLDRPVEDAKKLNELLVRKYTFDEEHILFSKIQSETN